MSDLVPATMPAQGNGGMSANLSGGTIVDRAKALTVQPGVKKMLPWFAGTAGLGVLALTWAAMSPAPQRMLYSSLDDAERASVVETLDTAGIAYTIDNNSGALTVGSRCSKPCRWAPAGRWKAIASGRRRNASWC